MERDEEAGPVVIHRSTRRSQHPVPPLELTDPISVTVGRPFDDDRDDIAGGVELLALKEQVDVISAVCLHPQAQLPVARNSGVLREDHGELCTGPPVVCGVGH